MTAAQSIVKNVDLTEVFVEEGFNPRRVTNKKQAEELKSSIALHGVLQPILCRPRVEGGFWVVAGHSRCHAARELGLLSIPALIQVMSDSEALTAAIIENATRADVSPIDEGAAATRLLASGKDKEEVQRLLGWSRTKLDSRILLTHAQPEVAQALVDGDIQIGHAELLAGMRSTAQASALRKILSEGISVKDFRERLEKASLRLQSAIFRLDACNGCQHNSDSQKGLFATALDAARCLNPSCFQLKTDQRIEEIKTETLESHATVALDREVAAGSFIELSKDAVGEAQFGACQNCQHHGAIIKTQLGDAGVVVKGQCFNLACHGVKIQAEKKRKADMIVTDKKPHVVAAQSTPRTQPPKADEDVGVGRLSSALVERHHQVHRAAAQHRVLNDRSAALATAILAVTKDGGLPDKGGSRAESFRRLMQYDEAELMARLVKLTAQTLKESKDRFNNDNVERDTFGGLAIEVARQADLSLHFTVDESYLTLLTKGGIETLLTESGFAAQYQSTRSAKEYKSLLTAKKPELIKAILAEGYDFKGYVPTTMEIK